MIPRQLLFLNATQVVTCAGPARARRGREMADAGVMTGVAVAVEGERIAQIGAPDELRRAYPEAKHIDCHGGLLMPGLVDSHTHAVFGRPRYEEHEMRAAGLSYMEIAAKGGGIHATVRDVRHRRVEDLAAFAERRLRRLASYGATTIEVKSGYGLTTPDELKMLEVIALVSKRVPMRLVPTWMGAHEIPEEYRGAKGGSASYVKMLVQEMLPQVTRHKLARFADVFCEPGVFSPSEAKTVLEAAKSAGLALKIHADEFENSGGAELAAQLGAVSADHLGAISPAGIRALAGAPTVATLLPGTLLFLGRTQQAPARGLIDGGAAVALATDFNPGTSPTPNLPLILTLGVSVLRMSVAEVIVAATVNGAAALGLADTVGQIAPGFSADLALFECEDVRELPYWYGERRCRGTWVRGQTCHSQNAPIS
jgi:imidazolonepropionase